MALPDLGGPDQMSYGGSPVGAAFPFCRMGRSPGGRADLPGLRGPFGGPVTAEGTPSPERDIYPVS
jgi:hypothetical protein